VGRTRALTQLPLGRQARSAQHDEDSHRSSGPPPYRRGYQGAEACSANAAMDQLCATYNDEQLELLADFLRRTTDAGRAATEQLAGG
jgi:hypothetical protein